MFDNAQVLPDKAYHLKFRKFHVVDNMKFCAA